MNRHSDNAIPAIICKATVPMYWNNLNALIQDRTGVLVRLAQRHLLLTAAHELDEATSEQLNGKLYVSPVDRVVHPQAERGSESLMLDVLDVIHDKEMDITVLELGPQCVKALRVAHKRFLRATSLCKVENCTGDVFHVLGYDNEQFYRDSNGSSISTTSEPRYFTTTRIRIARYSRLPHVLCLRLPKTVHLVEKEDIEGLSGGGMWMELRASHGSQKLLTGIFTHGSLRPRTCRGTRIQDILGMILEKWPDTAKDIKKVRTYPFSATPE